MLVFVCHASEDKPQVRELCRRLRADGIDAWLDEERLLPGQDWEMEISAAVEQSDAVLVCLSRSSVEKVGYLQKELRRVLDVAEYQPEGRIFVIPVRLEDCAVPARLNRWQYADLFVENGYELLRQSLVEGVAGHKQTAASARAAQPLVLAPGRRRRRRLAWAIAAIAVAAAAAGIGALWRPRPAPVMSSPPAISGLAAPAEAIPDGMVAIPGGRFLMGKSDDGESSPAHVADVKPFLIDRDPVTTAQFAAFLRSSNRVSQWNGSAAPNFSNQPATRVTWDEAAAYCLAGGKRLPSEVEWEFAARGTDGRLYPWGEAFDPAAVNSFEAGLGRSEPVGSRPLNQSPFHVRDMSGNVWQWCADDYRPYEGHRSEFTIPSQAKAIRGGSFQSAKNNVTAVARNLELPSTRSPVIGFRCAK